MNTDIACEVLFPTTHAPLAETLLEEAFAMMRQFEARYSRFKTDNELHRFNESAGGVVSPELFDLLSQAQKFYLSTSGLFDPSILPALEHIGYTSTPSLKAPANKSSFSQVHLDHATLTVTKPRDLFIDLGGIGKGYIVDRVADFLSLHFEHFLIDAGGDIFAKGSNIKEGYPYWAIDVEHPDPQQEMTTLLLHDMAVATSGRTRRHWKQGQAEKHHLIDPRTQDSAVPDYQSVTVIAKSTTEADILAKTLFIAGKNQAPLLAEAEAVPAIFIDSAGRVSINRYAEPYVWKTH